MEKIVNIQLYCKMEPREKCFGDRIAFNYTVAEKWMLHCK